MLELLVVMGVLGVLAAVWVLSRIAKGLERINSNLDRLQSFLFVRLPQPTPQELQGTKDAIIHAARVNLQDVSLAKVPWLWPSRLGTELDLFLQPDVDLAAAVRSRWLVGRLPTMPFAG